MVKKARAHHLNACIKLLVSYEKDLSFTIASTYVLGVVYQQTIRPPDYANRNKRHTSEVGLLSNFGDFIGFGFSQLGQIIHSLKMYSAKLLELDGEKPHRPVF